MNLTASNEQLVLIGDHRQLRPKTQAGFHAFLPPVNAITVEDASTTCIADQFASTTCFSQTNLQMARRATTPGVSLSVAYLHSVQVVQSRMVSNARG